jgi:hypothetical protein
LDLKPFLAKNWLKKEDTKPQTGLKESSIPPIPVSEPNKEYFPDFGTPLNQTNSDEDSPKKFFIPGWNGDSLQSKHVLKFQAIIGLFQDDIKRKLTRSFINRSLKQSIFEEYVHFSEYFTVTEEQFENANEFWLALSSPKPKQNVAKFLEIYSLRIFVIYFFKIRFLTHLKDKANIQIKLKDIINPNAFIFHTFKKTSSFELLTKAFEKNIYNWYRPDSCGEIDLNEVVELIPQLSICDIVKTTSVIFENKFEFNQYSHVFSHKNFGLFLNSLLLNYSNWSHSITHNALPKSLTDNYSFPETVSCKFKGSYLESMSLSFWLAQKNNSHLKWKQILCSDFKGKEFETGLFMSLFNELQLLTFLVEVSKQHSYSTLGFVTQAMKQYRENKKDEVNVQRSFFQDDLSSRESTYDRIVLNLCVLPKNNPYFYIINEISKQKKSLKDNGEIFVLCNKNFFIPSQKEKINQLLKDFSIECCIHTENIVGKGEVPHFIFIFKKNNTQESKYRQSFKTFRFNGELETFYDFAHITNSLQDFFRTNLYEAPPYYRKEVAKGLIMEFYHDAIVDGRYVSSPSKDSNHITHPNFFNNLIKSCIRFDNFFDVTALKEENSYESVESLINLQSQNQYKYLAIVDFRSDKQTNVEIIPATSLKAKINDYGLARCQYFGLTPLYQDVNINLVREFLHTSFGRQLIDFTFNGGNTKLKSKLSALLIPRLLLDNKVIPDFIQKGFSILQASEEEISQLKPEELTSKLELIFPILNSTFEKYPKAVLSQLVQFKRSLSKIKDKTNINENDFIQAFQNKSVTQKLMSCQLSALYPNNEEIHVELNLTDKSNLNFKFNNHKHIEKYIGNEILHGIELKHDEQTIVRVYSDKYLIYFLNYLLGFFHGKTFQELIPQIQVPKAKEIEKIIKNLYKRNKAYQDLAEQIDKLISSFFLLSLHQK